MLFQVGTKRELPTLSTALPEQVIEQLSQEITALDALYGEGRNYRLSGGYSLIATDSKDIPALKQIIDIETHPCEVAAEVGSGTDYLSLLFVLNNDFSIAVYLPKGIVPTALLTELED